VRQLPIEPYFADFACRERRLVIELDGSQHADNAYDRVRDAFMQEAGYSVLRFWYHDVRANLRSVCETILAVLDGRLSEVAVSVDMKFLPARPNCRPPHRLAALGTSPPSDGGEE